MKLITSFLFLLSFAGAVLAQTASGKISSVALEANKTTTVEGSLKEGRKVTDLSWAWSSSIACFPGTQSAKFTGNHVFFVTDLPPRSILTVTVKPSKSGVDLSIYGYQIAPTKVIFPEDLQSCVTCEADHKWDYPKRGKTQGGERTIEFNATTNSYKIVVGVVGSNGLAEGDFSLSFALKQ